MNAGESEGSNNRLVTAEDTSGAEGISGEDVLESGEAACSWEDLESLPSDGDLQYTAARILYCPHPLLRHCCDTQMHVAFAMKD